MTKILRKVLVNKYSYISRNMPQCLLPSSKQGIQLINMKTVSSILRYIRILLDGTDTPKRKKKSTVELRYNIAAS